MSAKSSLEDSERIAAIKALVKACKRPVPDTLYASMVIHEITIEVAKEIMSGWEAKGFAQVHHGQWGNTTVGESVVSVDKKD